MTDQELIRSLEYLVNKYIKEESLKKNLLCEIHDKNFQGAKGILHEINLCDAQIDSEDAMLIKDIVFNYV